MGAPAPWRQVRAVTAFLRVPDPDWLAVKQGRKTEFRVTGKRAAQFQADYLPTPVVAYAVRGGQHDGQLMVLTESWREPLGNIAENEESLRREGYPDFAAFRRYWLIRTHRRFRPLDMCVAYRLRPFDADDYTDMGVRLLERLYGEHL